MTTIILFYFIFLNKFDHTMINGKDHTWHNIMRFGRLILNIGHFTQKRKRGVHMLIFRNQTKLPPNIIHLEPDTHQGKVEWQK